MTLSIIWNFSNILKFKLTHFKALIHIVMEICSKVSWMLFVHACYWVCLLLSKLLNCYLGLSNFYMLSLLWINIPLALPSQYLPFSLLATTAFFFLSVSPNWYVHDTLCHSEMRNIHVEKSTSQPLLGFRSCFRESCPSPTCSRHILYFHPIFIVFILQWDLIHLEFISIDFMR